MIEKLSYHSIKTILFFIKSYFDDTYNNIYKLSSRFIRYTESVLQ